MKRDKIKKILFSSEISLILLLVFAAAMAAATFIENDYGTKSAWATVYDSWWFELILIWLSFTFLNHIKKYKLFSKHKWAIGLFHISLIIIIIGAGLTRYLSVSGMMHIREGQEQNVFYSTENYLQLKLNQDDRAIIEKKLNLISENFKSKSIKTESDEFNVSLTEYLNKAERKFVEGNDTFFEVSVIQSESPREDYIVKLEDKIIFADKILSLENDDSPIKIYKKEEKWFIYSDENLQITDLETQNIGVLHKGEEQELRLKNIYESKKGAFVVYSINENKKLTYQEQFDFSDEKNLSDYLKIEIQDKNGNLISEAFIRLGLMQPDWHSFVYKNKTYKITYGPKQLKLPFALKLNKFDLERYPGSQSPSSYASEVTVKSKKEEFPYQIFMNNVLDYGGYRFYQSSYDSDEKGTILSVNKDRPGTYLTYTGYSLLTLGMFFAFFVKGGRFHYLNVKLKRNKTKTFLSALLLFFSIFISAQEAVSREIVIVPNEISENYGRLIVQDLDGRMKPINTLSNEILRKLTGKSYFEIKTNEGRIKLNSDEFLLALQLDPVWFNHLPLLKADSKKLKKVYELANIPDSDYLSFESLLDENGNYILHTEVENANKLKPSERNDYHKELLKLDERFNILYGLFSGSFLKIFPNKSDSNNTWFTASQSQMGFEEEDALFVENITPLFLSAIEKGVETNDWSEAQEALSYIKTFQEEAGKEVYPSKNRIEMELLYTKLNLSNRLFVWFWILGIALLGAVLIGILKTSKTIEIIWKSGFILSWAGFLFFTFDLILRWYVAEHPPWSDGFEMLVFVAWCTLFFGLFFSNKSKFALPTSLLFTGTLLFVGFLDWLNPEITNLMPVLNSYWLKIHVAVIVAGYAPLGLSWVLSMLTLILIAFKPRKANDRWWRSLREIIIVNEMGVLIGLFLFTVGTFLGGVWANESWGRYWAWDPKETWALISVVVYALILHLRLIPALKNAFVYSIFTLWGFSTIIMTSFGVNYYLSGLHSYAQGDPVPIPFWVYVIVILFATLTIFSVVAYRKFSEKEKRNLKI